MKLVLTMLIDNLFAFTSHHSFTFSSSKLTRASRVLRLFAEAKTLVSSAKIWMLYLLKQLDKLFNM